MKIKLRQFSKNVSRNEGENFCHYFSFYDFGTSIIMKSEQFYGIFWPSFFYIGFSIASCSIEILRFLTISIVELKNTHFRRVLPVFWAFPVQGLINIASRTIVREVMMGPRTGNAQKTGKTEAEMGILKLNNGNVRNLKILMLHIVLWHFFHIGTKTVFLGTLPITKSYEYSLPT